MALNTQLTIRSAASLVAAAALSAPASAALIDFQLDDPAGTTLPNLTDDGSPTSSFTNGPANVVTDGTGFLVLTTGSNAFVPTTPELNLTTGTYTLEFEFLDATIDSGTSAPQVKFGLRDSGGTELFRVGLDKQAGDLRLELNIGATVVELVNFNATSFTGPLNVRAVLNLDTEDLDIFWTGAANGSSLDNVALDGELDQVRLSANLQFLGATDEVKVDFVTLVPEPASLALVGLGLIAVIRPNRKPLPN